MSEENTTDQNETISAYDNIIQIYESIVVEKQRLPTYSDFIDYDISRDKIRNNFGNLTKLHQKIEDDHSHIIEEYIAHESVLFSKKKLDELNQNLQNYKRFFITTAVTEKAVDAKALAAVKSYCEINNALLLILPCADVASTRKRVHWTFDSTIKNEHFIHEETSLNTKLFLSNIKLSAKQIMPTTGLSRIGQRNGSYIFASPKQSLEYVATSPQKDRTPMALMTPGAITVADYRTDKYMSERTSYIAESDHVMGGIIVEIENSKKFYFRQVQFNQNGEFIDLAKRYYPDGNVEDVEVHLYAGDWHSGETDNDVVSGLEKLFEDIEVSDFIVGDFFNGHSISHHTINIPLKRVKRTMENRQSIVEELKGGGADINWLHGKIHGNIVMITGNHDLVLQKYLENGSYVKDDNNHYHALELAKLYLEGENVIREAYRIHGKVDDFDRILWLGRDDGHKIAHIECGAHGDLGPSGTKGTLLGLEKAYGNCIVGHTHSAAILRGVFRVGTFTKFDLDYVSGPTAWTHTGCLIANDGSRQMINFIHGEYKLRD